MNFQLPIRRTAGSPPIRMRFGERDRVTVGGVAMRYLRETEDGSGHLLERCDAPGICVAFGHDALWKARSEPGFRYDPEFFSESANEASALAAIKTMGDIPRREQEVIGWRLRHCQEIRDLEDERRRMLTTGPREPDPADPSDDVLRVSRSDAGLTIAYAILDRRERERAASERAEAKAAGAVVKRAPRGGKSIVVKKRPGFKSLRKWLKLLAKSGGDPSVLRTRYHLCGSRDRKVSDEAERFMAEAAKRYASANRPTKKQLYKELVADVDEHNSGLPTDAPKVRVPSRDTFHRRIRTMNAFLVHYARYGAKSAQDRFRPVTIGVGATIPGERVEIDEWNMQLHILLIWSGMWDGLTEEEREEVKRHRVWVCIAIDCATRIVLGMALSETASADAAIAVLRMIVSDKTPYSDGVDARTPWSMAVRPKTIVTDAGSTFLSDRFRAKAAALRIDNVTAIAGKPSMRGTEERFNSTIHTALIGRFSGRTFENPVAKGKYPSKKRASMTLDWIAWAVVRWLCDEYHLTPHAGLFGQMPLKAWEEQGKKYGIAPPPGRDELRNVFGIDVRRRTGPRGVRLLGLHYQGEALQEHRRIHGDGEADLRYDPADIGAVSVKLGDAWHPVDCVTPGFDGVSMGDWRLAATALKRKYGEEAALAQPVVNQAVREIRDLAKRSLDFFGLDHETPTQETVDRAEKELLIGFRMPERDDAEAAADPFAGEAPASDPVEPPASPDRSDEARTVDDLGTHDASATRRRPLRFKKD